ncbi:protein phosphatase 1 regulatory subunit 27-like [Watersipora subatra]|uniref:protein phosphatase 1 regulatory subunit 27-like n=1 Tax=Watersipora subatra TaxID=2589382 RepID=UPI00355B7B93
MSRRASVFKKQNPGKRRVRFPDELVFQDVVEENDTEQLNHMLRRASLQVDINAINSRGLTALHQAVLDNSFSAVRIILKYGAKVNMQDEDSWTPLHAACCEGNADIARYLLKRGADPTIQTTDGERPIDLCDATDFATISVLLNHQQASKSMSESKEYENDGTIHEADETV